MYISSYIVLSWRNFVSFQSFSLRHLEGNTKRERKIRCKQENISFFTAMSLVFVEKEEIWSDVA